MGLGDVGVEELLRLPALEEAERIRCLEILAPEVLEAAGVTPAGPGHLGQAGEDVVAILWVKTE